MVLPRLAVFGFSGQRIHPFEERRKEQSPRNEPSMRFDEPCHAHPRRRWLAMEEIFDIVLRIEQSFRSHSCLVVWKDRSIRPDPVFARVQTKQLV